MKPGEMRKRVTLMRHLAWVGFETDIIFNHGVDLPCFASFPLLKTDEGRACLTTAIQAQADNAREHGLGLIVETPTWVANADRAEPLDYDGPALAEVNRAAVAFCREVAPDAVISLNVGPRGDGYGSQSMTAADAQSYHDAQIAAGEEADVISAYTINTVAEAVGIARAAAARILPSVISFTVETDGRLPDGTPLTDAIAATDAETGSSPDYYMVNCAHPDHFSDALGSDRIMGLIANASRLSHAELDNAEELDDGDPFELAAQLSDLSNRHPALCVFGGCCGTDMRHMTEIAGALA